MAMKHYHMGANLIVEIIKGKWKPSIICALGIQDRRYNELLKYEREANEANISKKVLTQQLKELEEDNIVERTNYGTVPPKVVYSLTPEGEKLRRLVVDMSLLGESMAADDSDIELEFSYRDMLNNDEAEMLNL